MPFLKITFLINWLKYSVVRRSRTVSVRDSFFYILGLHIFVAFHWFHEINLALIDRRITQKNTTLICENIQMVLISSSLNILFISNRFFFRWIITCCQANVWLFVKKKTASNKFQPSYRSIWVWISLILQTKRNDWNTFCDGTRMAPVLHQTLFYAKKCQLIQCHIPFIIFSAVFLSVHTFYEFAAFESCTCVWINKSLCKY